MRRYHKTNTLALTCIHLHLCAAHSCTRMSSSALSPNTVTIVGSKRHFSPVFYSATWYGFYNCNLTACTIVRIHHHGGCTGKFTNCTGAPHAQLPVHQPVYFCITVTAYLQPGVLVSPTDVHVPTQSQCMYNACVKRSSIHV